MIAWTIAQIGLLGGLLAMAAWGGEAALRAAGRPTRWAWVGALVMLVALAALTPMQATTARSADMTVVLPATTTTTTVIAEPTGLFATLGSAWQAVTAAATRTAQQGWSLWKDTVPAGTDRLLLAAWLIASVALLLVFAAVHLRFQRRRAQWPVGTVHGTTVRIAGDVGPAVIGVTKAEIVVPQWLLTRDDREQELVLAHEREHVRVRDPLLLAIAQAVIVLLPWHPAVWWMASRLRLAVELDCDRRVLQRGANARDYGTLLIDLTDHRTGFGAALPAFSCTPSHLERRLIAMTPKPLRYPLVRVLSTGALASLALLAACEAKLPTDAEVDGMTAKTAVTTILGKAAYDSTGVVYFVDGARVSKEAVDELSAEQIASVNVNQGTAKNSATVHVVTRNAENQPTAARVIFTTPGSSITLIADTINMRRILKGDSTASGGAQPLNKIRMKAEGRPDIVVGTSTLGGAQGGPASGFNGLLVVDGTPRPNSSMNSINPDQIESINVIKGPAATVKYSDPRAANGVIEIITKKATP